MPYLKGTTIPTLNSSRARDEVIIQKASGWLFILVQIMEECVVHPKERISTIGDLTITEFKILLKETVEEVLQEILVDPDQGLPLKAEFEARLRAAKTYVTSGGRLLSLDELLEEVEDRSVIFA